MRRARPVLRFERHNSDLRAVEPVKPVLLGAPVDVAAGDPQPQPIAKEREASAKIGDVEGGDGCLGT